MQREAEQRVREMQSRARLVGEENDFFPAPQRKNPSPQNFHRQDTPQSDPFSAITGNIDNDKMIILALLWLLWNEHADSKLLLALLYLLL